MHLLLNCYVERRDGWWKAVCPDLNFAVTGHSFMEAHEQLARRIQQYVKYVETFPEEERPGFYDRRITMWGRLGLALSVALTALSSPPHRAKQSHRTSYTYVCAS
jgi:hypothetical protein